MVYVVLGLYVLSCVVVVAGVRNKAQLSTFHLKMETESSLRNCL
jgi:hypothetical protein